MKWFSNKRATRIAERTVKDLDERVRPLALLILAAKTTENFDPVWPALANATLFVPVLVEDETAIQTSDYRFRVGAPASEEAEGSLMVAENPQFIASGGEPFNVIQMPAAKLIKQLNPAVDLIIGLPAGHGSFVVPAGKLQWLRDSIQPAD